MILRLDAITSWAFSPRIDADLWPNCVWWQFYDAGCVVNGIECFKIGCCLHRQPPFLLIRRRIANIASRI